MSWPSAPLGTVASIQLGKMLSPKARAGNGAGRYLRNSNVQWGELDLTDLLEMDFDDREREKFSLRRGDLIVCEGGEPGRCTVLDADLPNVFFQKALMRVRTDERRLHSRFLQRYMHYAAARGAFTHGGNKATIAHFPAERMNAFRVPLAPLAEQRRIADILDKADGIRRKRKEAIALTEELLRSTFLEMVGPGARDYGRWERRPIETLAAGQANAMRTGPFGSDLRHSEFVSEGIAVLGIDNAVQNRFAWGERRYITPEKYERLRRYTVHPGDVIVTIMGTTGRSAVVPADIPPAITTKHLATITLDRTRADPEFVSQALFRHPDLLDQIRAANRGAIMSGLNLGLIKALKLPLPPVARQREFARFTAQVRTMSAGLETARADADAMFASLTARCFGAAA